MPRIRCNYEGCIHLEGKLCTAREIELDQELGCLTFSQVEDEREAVVDEEEVEADRGRRRVEETRTKKTKRKTSKTGKRMRTRTKTDDDDDDDEERRRLAVVQAAPPLSRTGGAQPIGRSYPRKKEPEFARDPGFFRVLVRNRSSRGAVESCARRCLRVRRV